MANTREKIVNGAVTLFIEHGVARTTTREISARSQVAEGSIYRYFPSKDELAWQVFRDYHKHIAKCLLDVVVEGQTVNTKITALVHCLLRLADEDWIMFQYYLVVQHSYINKVSAESTTPYQIIFDCVQNAASNKEIECHDPHTLAAMVIGSVYQVIINKVYKRMDGQLSEYREEVSRAACRIISPYQEKTL